YSSTAVLAALAHRDVSGIGQHIDLALLDVQVACLANQTLNYLTTGVPPRRLGNAHPNIVPYQDFPTACLIYKTTSPRDNTVNVVWRVGRG
ncbi:CoA transferase, partial [Pseudomonas aeruginosa]|uniref:CoA transferase n=1 Tax=Pseudomonas aeruginosa TaxID=287 RepID=UPI003CC5D965